MRLRTEYDSGMTGRIAASVAGLALVILALAAGSVAQVHGVPASVTSQNFGGHYNPTPGVAPSVTSLGPRGYTSGNQFFHQPNCCINPLFPVNSNPPGRFNHRRHEGRNFYRGGAIYAVPYYYSPYGMEEPSEEENAQQNAEQPADEYRGGPTIFDRRGPGTPSQPILDKYAQHEEAEASALAATAPPAPAAAPEPPQDQPQTVLVFKDGHQLEVQNYAIVGSTLYDLTPGRNHKIAVADLDLAATAKQNDDRGIDFELPKVHNAN